MHYRTGAMLQVSGLVWIPCRDYRPNEVLDAYEDEGSDEELDMDVTLEEQLAAQSLAERELNKRDRRENRGFLRALNGEVVMCRLCHRPQQAMFVSSY